MTPKDTTIKAKLDAMTLDQKVGALMTLGFNGTLLTPNIFEYVSRYHCGGLRLTPPDRKFGNYVDPRTGKTMVSIKGNEYYYKEGVPPAELTGAEYKTLLDELAAAARARPLSLPLHFSFDNEGEGNCSFSGFGLFPFPMGLAATGDASNAYRVAKAIGRQARSVGMNMIHSPVLDVNCDARNPEINIRSYSDRAEVVAEFALQTCRGFKEAKVAATGKHFPGRGDSAVDAHYAIPHIGVDFDTLWNRELLPYRTLIDHDVLPAIMLAHTIYAAIDPDEVATVSRKVVTGLLRDKMGFRGVITTDSMTMTGIAGRYGVPEACALSLAAGADLVLMKAQNDLVGHTFAAIKAYVEDGKIPEAELDAKVIRVLGMKYDLGLFDPAFAAESPADLVADPGIKALETEVAEKACAIVRQETGALPLPKDKRFLLVEQVATERANFKQHPAMMFKEAIRHNPHLAFCETGFSADAADRALVERLVPGFDTIVLTNFQDRAMAGSTSYLNELIGRYPDKTFVLVTNKPYTFAIPEKARTVICTFAKTPASLAAAVRLIFGGFEATGRLPSNCDALEPATAR
jgi:beta-N-acetylhexosaminidase